MVKIRIKKGIKINGKLKSISTFRPQNGWLEI